MANTSVALVTQIQSELEKTKPKFESINMNNLSFQKEMEFAIQIFAGNDYLAKTSQQSVFNCLVNVALSGLTLNPVMKLAYLVPRKGLCCLDPSYQGLIKIVTDTGAVKSIRSNVVYEKDTFDIELGSGGFIKHKPYLGVGSSGREIGAYSLAVLNDGTSHIEWMKWEDIMSIRARSESVKANKTSPWDTDQNEMAKKTVVKRHFKYLPKSERALMAASAIDLDNQINGIDFEAEQEQKQLATDPKGAIAESVEMADEADFNAIMDCLNDGLWGDKVFKGTRDKKKTIEVTQWNYDNNKLTKERAIATLNALQTELAEIEHDLYTKE